MRGERRGLETKMFEKAFLPSFEEGRLRPRNKMSRYLKQGAAGEVRKRHCLTSPAAPSS